MDKSDNSTRINILGVGIDPVNLTIAVARVEEWVSQRTRSYAIVRDVHGVVRCEPDAELRCIHKQAGLAAPDGMPLVWLARAEAGSFVSHTYGPDFLTTFCRTTVGKGYRHYFYGAIPETVQRLVAELRKIDPNLIVAGTSSPPFRPLADEEDAAVVNEINSTSPDLVRVGLGTLKQERWMNAHVGHIKAPAMLGIGAAFGFISGNKRHVPVWMHKPSLEWLFRLATEPCLVGGRYLRTLPTFVAQLIAQHTGLRRYAL